MKEALINHSIELSSLATERHKFHVLKSAIYNVLDSNGCLHPACMPAVPNLDSPAKMLHCQTLMLDMLKLCCISNNFPYGC